jgi:hypothetical protein
MMAHRFVFEDRVYLTRNDIKRAGDFSQAIRLDYYPYKVFVMERPVFDMWGRVGPVRVVLAECARR